MVTAAGRLAAAFDFVKRPDEAERIQKAFAKFKIALKLVNPFELAEPSIAPSKERSPYVLRLRSMWAGWRQDVINTFRRPDLYAQVRLAKGAWVCAICQ